MDNCSANNTIVNKVEGKVFDGPIPELLYMELNSIAKTGPGGSAMAAMRIVDAGAELERIRLISSRYGGVPVAVAMAFRITQEVTGPAPAGANTDMVLAPFRERHALTEVLCAPGKLSDAYFRGVTRKVGPLNDRMCVGLAPVIVHKTFQLLGAAFGQHFNADRSPNGMTFTGSPQFAQAKPLYGMAPAQNRIVYAKNGFSEPFTGSPNGDLFVFPFTVDGIDGEISKSGIALQRITDGSGSSYWTWTFTPYNNVDLYYPGTSFGNITITPILVYRIERPEVGADGSQVIVEAEVWEDRFNLPTTDTSVTPFSSADVQDHSFVGWLPDVWTDETDGGNYYWLNLDTGPTPDYTPLIRVIPPSFQPGKDLWTNGNYLSIGDGAVEQFPNDVSANGARFIADCNSLNGYQDKQFSLANPPPVGMFAEMHDYNASGLRSSNYTYCVSGIVNSLRYGSSWSAAGPGGAVSAWDNTVPGVAGTSDPAVQLGGYQFWPIAFCNKTRKGFPGIAVRAVGDTRPIVATKVGGFATPVRPSGVGFVGWRVSLQRTRGVFSQCLNNTKGTPGVSPVVYNAASSKAAIGGLLTPSSATVLNLGQK